MIGKIFLTVILIFLFQNACADDDNITLNGVFGNKAILTIDGESLVLGKGEKSKGVKLIKVSDEQVEIEYRKKRKILKFKSNLMEKSLSSDSDFDPNNSKTQILSANLLTQTNGSATFDVDYFYNGQHGQYVTLTAKTVYRGNITDYWSHTYTRLNFGRNHAEIIVNMNEAAPKSYFSDSIRFEIVWADEIDSGVLGSKTIELVKEWKR